jgi:hypothetical protein
MSEAKSPSFNLTPRLQHLLLRSNLPSPSDLKRLASYLHQDYLRQLNDAEEVLSILSDTREMLQKIAETLERHDSAIGGNEDGSS